MSSDVGKIAGLLGAATALNTSYQIGKHIDPVPSIVAAGILFALLAGFGSAAGAGGLRIAKLFAGLILFSVFIGRGYYLFSSTQKLLGGLTVPTPNKK